MDVVCVIKPVPVPTFIIEPDDTIEILRPVDIVHQEASHVRTVNVLVVFIEDFDETLPRQMLREEHRSVVIPYSFAKRNLVYKGPDLSNELHGTVI